MSDFLRNVLRRGAGLAPVVSPRRPLTATETPYLESAPAETVPPMPGNESEAAPPQRRPADMPAAPATPVTRVIHEAPPAAPVAPRPLPVNERVELRVESKPAAEPQRATTARESRVVAEPVAPAVQPAPPPNTETMVVLERTAAAPPPLVTVAPAVPVGPVPHVMPRPRAEDPVVEALAAPRVEVRETTTVRQQTAVQVAMPAPVLPPSSAMPAPSIPPAAPASPPTVEQPKVQVSIGRVEFVQVPARQPAPRRAPSGFSGRALERRYLDRRWY